MEKVALVAVSILLAAISWRLVEKPFRDKPYRLGAIGTLLAGVGAMISASVTAIVVSPIIEKVWTYPSRATEVFSYAKNWEDESHMRGGSCFLFESHDYEFRYQKECLDVRPGSLNVLIVGDSYAAHLWSGLQTSYPSINFLQATAAACIPIIGGKSNDPLCSKMMNYIYEEFLPRAHLDGIIISARWGPEDIQAAIQTAQAFLPYADRVFLFGPLAEYDQALPRILARAIASGKSESKLAETHRRADPQEVDRTFSSALKDGPVEYVSVYRALCDPECELWAAKDVPLQFDAGHLTREGSIALARKIGPQLFPKSSLPSAFRAMRQQEGRGLEAGGVSRAATGAP